MTTSDNPAQVTTLQVAGMDCPDEIAALRAAFRDADGVEHLDFNLLRGTVAITHDPQRAPLDRLKAYVARAGLNAKIADQAGATQAIATPASRGPLRATMLSGGAAILGLLIAQLPAPALHHTTLPAAGLYLLAIAAAWRYVLPKAWAALRRRQLDMNVLMTIAVLGAIGLGEWFEATTVAFLFLLSHLLETWSVTRARRAIQDLMEQSPQQARVLSPDGSEQLVDVTAVTVGTRLRVRPGEKLPLDGVVQAGESTVNQAPITGESVPLAKQPGDEVFAGTINHDGALEIEVTKSTADTVLASIIRLVEQAQSRRARVERFVDQFARIYTPVVVGLAVLIAVAPPLLAGASWAAWFYRALVLLVIACPCALVISTPVAVVSALAAAARHGVLVKGGEFLEAVGRVRAIALDKTGTLTGGRPVVQEVIPLNGAASDQLIATAAAIERHSEHPIGQAIVAYAEAHAPPPGVAATASNYQAVRGKGATATYRDQRYLLGNHRLLAEHGLDAPELATVVEQHTDCQHTVVALASETQPLGVFLLADQVRPEAATAVRALRAAGVAHLVMLTGDNAGTAQAIAAACGDLAYRAELLPADKVTAVEELRQQTGAVAMVGDGVNDAPALAAANIGVAMGAAGTDAALETADVILMGDDLRTLPWLVRHSQRTRRIIAENIGLALAIKAIFLVLAVPGFANLWMAIAADMGGSLAVILNALRLLKSGSRASTEE
jgi:Zn2+/Cd2+-exporting ATPase